MILFASFALSIENSWKNIHFHSKWLDHLRVTEMGRCWCFLVREGGKGVGGGGGGRAGGQPLLVVRPSRGLTHQKTQSQHAFFPLSSSLKGQLSRRTSFFGKTLQMFPLLWYHQEIYLKRSIWVRNRNWKCPICRSLDLPPLTLRFHWSRDVTSCGTTNDL